MFRSIADVCGRGVVAFGRKLPDLTRDAAGLCAVGLIAYGAWLVYEPAGYIVGGVLLLVSVILTSLGKSKQRATGG